MEKTAAVTVCLFWLLLLLAVSTSASSPPTFLVPQAEAAENSWTTETSMPTARSGLGVAVVNGKIYAIGGTNRSWSTLRTNEMYDPATNTWATKKPMPTPREGFGIAVYQNKIYVMGGLIDYSSITGVNEVYDPATDTWETKQSMPTPRCELDANVVNGKIYLIGGRTSGAYTYPVSLNEVYDPATNSWTTTKAPIPKAVMDYASAVVNNKIYVISGSNYSSNLDLTQIYDPETDTWSNGASIPTAIKGAAAGATTGVAAPKRIYVMGGGSIVSTSLNQIYDPEKDVWITGASVPTSRRDLGVAVVDDILYAIGGDSGWTLNFYGANEQYTPVGYGTVPPTISIVSPENKTYTVNNVPLTFNVNKPAVWMGYSLDGQANVTILGNKTLTGLSDGSHSLTVYATDTDGNTGASEAIYFAIAQKTEPFPTWIVAAIAIIAIVGAAPLVYFIKNKKTTGKVE